jgi:GTP1/Obg family GTP-binding protein
MNKAETRPQQYTARLSFVEAPDVVAQLERRAYARGSSVAAEIREALREHLADKEK